MFIFVKRVTRPAFGQSNPSLNRDVKPFKITVMEATIKAIHFDITDKLVQFINKKIDKMSRRFEAITEVEVTLRVVKPETAMNKEAGIKMMVPPAADLFASKTADTFEEAIDLCLDALERQLEKNKDKDK